MVMIVIGVNLKTSKSLITFPWGKRTSLISSQQISTNQTLTSGAHNQHPSFSATSYVVSELAYFYIQIY